MWTVLITTLNLINRGKKNTQDGSQSCSKHSLYRDERLETVGLTPEQLIDTSFDKRHMVGIWPIQAPQLCARWKRSSTSPTLCWIWILSFVLIPEAIEALSNQHVCLHLVNVANNHLLWSSCCITHSEPDLVWSEQLTVQMQIEGQHVPLDLNQSGIVVH